MDSLINKYLNTWKIYKDNNINLSDEIIKELIQQLNGESGIESDGDNFPYTYYFYLPLYHNEKAYKIV